MRTFGFPWVENWQLPAGDPTLLQMVGAATLSLFTGLGPGRFARLLDALADCEQLHDITMID
jgi:hypothetical protein